MRNGALLARAAGLGDVSADHERTFGQRPHVFRNTELIFWDDLAPLVAKLGYRAILVEGADRVLAGRSPDHVYAAARAPGLRLLPRNYRLSDDVGFRFSDPLAEKAVAFIHALLGPVRLTRTS